MFKQNRSLVLSMLLTVLFAPWQQAHALRPQECQTDFPQTTPIDRFDIPGNGTVIDKQTGLIWQRCQLGLSGELCDQGSLEQYTLEQALQQAEQSDGWRLPNVKELHSIVEKQCFQPAINLTIFPNTLASGSWSSTLDAKDSDDAWSVNFKYGYSHNSRHDSYKTIRLVRNK